MHSLNQSETRFARERRLKEEFYDRYMELKNEWDKLHHSMGEDEQDVEF